MKKLFILAVLFFLVAIAIPVPVADAAPAPNLTKVQITGIGPDADQNWITPSNHSLNSNVFGDTLYICVEYIGYPNWDLVFFYQGGSLINKNYLNNYITEYITSGGVITGFRKAYSIPFARLPGNKTGYLGQFTVKATSINGGGTYQDYVNNVVKN